jgi:hypothetical protein
MKEIYKTTNHSINIYDGSEEVITTKHKKMLKRLSKLRSKVESGGVEFNGIVLKTDEGSIAKITSTVMALQSGMMQSIDWKGHNGWITDVGYEQMIGIATTVSMHIEKAFSTENKIASKIEAMSEEELDTFDLESEWDSYYQ